MKILHSSCCRAPTCSQNSTRRKEMHHVDRYNDLESAYKKKSEEGLSRLLGFLREIEEREQQEEIERLRPVGIQVSKGWMH